MGPYEYVVERIDGDYAHLKRTDDNSFAEILVAMALLPLEISEGTILIWENLEYKIL